MRINNKLTLSIHLVLAIFVIMWINNGLFSYITVYIPDIFKMAIFFIWLLIAVLKRKKMLRNFISRHVLLIFFFVLTIIGNYYSYSEYSANFLKASMFLLVISSLFEYYFVFSNLRETKIIISILFIDYFYVGLNTILKINENPGLSRYLSMSEENIVKILGVGTSNFLGIGNYTFAYSMVFIGLYFMHKIMFEKRKKYLWVIGYIFSVLLIIKMQFTIALFLLIMFSFLLFVFKTGKNKLLMGINISLLFIITIIGIYFLPDILILMAPLMPDRMNSKFIQLASYLNGVSIRGTDFRERLDLYLVSIDAFRNNIWFGALNNFNKIGGHATWLDFLGQFGILSIPIFVYFVKIHKFVSNRVAKNERVYVKTSFLYITLLGFINTIYSPRILLTLFIFVPLITRFNTDKKIVGKM